MGNVDFEGILTEKHHYWRNLIILFVAAAIVGSYLYVQTDSQQATTEEKLMTDFITENLKEEYHPDSLEIKQITLAGQEIYQANWEHGTTSLRIILDYNYNTENPDLMITLSQPKIENLNEEVSPLIASNYFNYNKQGNWECLSGNIIKTCGTTRFEGETKMSTGVSTNSVLNSSLVYACKTVPGSEKYNQYMCTSIV